MAADGRAIANFVLDLCAANRREITNLSLQKIIYFCHVWSLIKLERPLIRHNFEAWQYGPVLQYVYREFKAFESEPITIRAMCLDPMTGNENVAACEFDSSTRALLERVVDFYSRLTASDLVQLTHVEGGPWDSVWNHDGNVNPGMKIDNDSIRKYYSKIGSPYTLQ